MGKISAYGTDKVLTTFSSRKELWLAYFLAAYCAYYLIISLSIAWGYITDDAYISWFYARQLAHGHGLHWQNTEPPVEGYSNFLWVILAALIIKLQWPLAFMVKWISIFSLGAGLIFLYRLSRLFLSPLLAMLPVFVFSHYQGVVWWTASGLESAFFCALSLLFIWQGAAALGYKVEYTPETKPVKVSTGAWVTTNIVLLLLGLTRFEGIVWAIPLLFFIVCQVRKHGLHGFPQGRKTLYMWGMLSLCFFILPYAVYFIWRVHYFGHWIPNSYRCKALVSGQIGIVDLDFLRVAIALIVASVPAFFFSKDCRYLLLWLPSLLYGLMLWEADPLLAYQLRLFLGPLALLSLLAVLGVYQFLHHFSSARWDLKLMTSFVIIILTFAFIPGNNLNTLRAHVAEYQGRNQNRMMIANILNTQATPGASILLDDCGIIPFNARPDLRFIDSQCLNNEALAQVIYSNDVTTYVDYLQKQVKPEWVVMNKFSFTEHLNFLMDALAQKNFLKAYQLVATLRSRAAPDDPLASVDHYLVYKRKESIHDANKK